MPAGSGSVNPVIPAVWEAMVIVAGALIAALFIGALISIVRSRNHTPAGAALWVLAVAALPVLGPVLWFLTGRTPSRTGRPGSR